MRLKHGILDKLSKITGFSKPDLSDLAATRKRPSYKRSIYLEEKTEQAGYMVHHDLWLGGTSNQIKTQLNKIKIDN